MAPLRAVVVGAGFAGEGHTLALRSAGVTVEAICARQPDVVEAVAARLGVPTASTDWRATVEQLRPDIVSIATPASVRHEVAEVAAGLGCHLFCDKPLGTNGREARAMFALVEAAGVKHALAATHRYDPSVVWLSELVREGAIGTLREIEGTFRRHLPPLTPWTWYDTVATGGGLLHNAFPHWLGILKDLTGGELTHVMGAARTLRYRAPVVPELHDFRDRASRAPTAEAAEHLEWRACDSDNAFSALLRFQGAPRSTDASPGMPAPAALAAATAATDGVVHVTLLASGSPATWPPNGWRLHGEWGTLIADGQFGYQVSLQRRAGDPLELLPVPQYSLDALPQVGDEFQNKWAALARHFVADVRGEPFTPYLTFRDGWVFENAVDAIRDGRGWTRLPAALPVA